MLILQNYTTFVQEINHSLNKTTMNTTQKLLRDNAAIRWTALLLLALAMFCSYIFMDILSPIKDLIQSERGWDSTAF